MNESRKSKTQFSKTAVDMKQFEVRVHLEASTAYRVQAATRKRAEEIALDTAKGDAKRLEALRWVFEASRSG